MRIYKYSKDTKEYLGYMEANLDPLETIKRGVNVYAIPPCFTTVKPELPKPNHTMLFNGTSWEEIEDNRGLKVYHKKNGKELVITDLGPVPSTYQLEKPVFLETLRAEKIKEINNATDRAKREFHTINDIAGSAESWIELAKSLSAFDLFPTITIGEAVVTKGELEEAIRYFYIRSMLIPKRRVELLEQVNSTRSKKKLEEFVVDFDIEEKVQELMKLSKEELSERFKK